MKVGLALPHYDFSFPDGRGVSVDRVVEYAVRAEEAGFSSVCISDHFFLDLARYGGPAAPRYGSVEPMTTLAAVAAATSAIRLGALVLCYAFRSAPMLAKEAVTLDLLSGGRMELGIGAGWYEAEFRAMGIPMPPLGERVSAFREYLQTVRGLLDGDALIPPPSRRMPVWVGSKGGERMMRTIARHADGWNTVWRWTPDAYEGLVAKLDAACAREGRDPRSVRRNVGLLTLLGESDADVESRWRAMQRWAPAGALDATTLEEFRRDTLVGTPAQCAQRLRAFFEMGAEEIILSLAGLPFAVHDDDQIRLARELIAHVSQWT